MKVFLQQVLGWAFMACCFAVVVMGFVKADNYHRILGGLNVAFVLLVLAYSKWYAGRNERDVKKIIKEQRR
jgi:hypothetical protein